MTDRTQRRLLNAWWAIDRHVSPLGLSLGLALLAIGWVLAATLSAQGVPYYPTEWNTNGIKTAPNTSVTLCEYVETAETAETHSLRVVLSSEGLGFFAMDQVDADGSTIVRSHAFMVSSGSYETNMLIITLNPGEKLRVHPAIAIGLTLRVQCSIFKLT